MGLLKQELTEAKARCLNKLGRFEQALTLAHELVSNLFIYLFTTLAAYGTQREHGQYDTWSLLGLAPFVGEQVTVDNTDTGLSSY